MVKKNFNSGLLIFDLDGTLVDTVEDLVRAVNFSLHTLGYAEQSLTILAGYIGDGVSKLLQRAFASEEERLIEKALHYFRNYYREHLCDYSQVYTGVKALLDCYQHKKLAVLTNKTQEFAEELLRQTGLRNRFDMVIGGGAGYAYKPDPEALLAILQTINGHPSRAMIIGDSPNDIKAGKNAGIKTCAVSYGYTPREVLQQYQADIMIDHPAELLQFVSTGQ